MNPCVRMWRALLFILCATILPVLGACSSFAPQAVEPCADDCPVYTQSKHDITVSTNILSDEQAERLYGVDLASVGLQAVWLRIENNSDHSHWFLVSAMDPNYFAPDEAAALFDLGLSDEDEARAREHFRDLSIPLKTVAGAVTEGYVLAPRHEGGRYLVVILAGRQHVVDFGFGVPLPDGDFDFEQLQPSQIYAGLDRPDLDLAELRKRLIALPCCAADEVGNTAGDPLNLVVVGDIGDVLAALSRAGWSFTHRIDFDTVRRLIGAAISGAAYPVAPVSPLYMYDRAQDLALQRARNTILQRNHLRLWLAPFRFEGQSVWIGQVSRDISVKPTLLSATLTTHVIDPNVDEAREHLLQSLMVAGMLQRFGFVAGIPPAPPTSPRRNLTDDPYFTDGLRLFLQLNGRGTTSPEDIEFLDWQKSPDPLGEAWRDAPATGG
ncbi:MAG: LssY C-terminal domain-containing protein [Halieaceae bacterium]|nr:LssY C-terminal domain-containing protein [Halieaceae bacterium]